MIQVCPQLGFIRLLRRKGAVRTVYRETGDQRYKAMDIIEQLKTGFQPRTLPLEAASGFEGGYHRNNYGWTGCI